MTVDVYPLGIHRIHPVSITNLDTYGICIYFQK